MKKIFSRCFILGCGYFAPSMCQAVTLSNEIVGSMNDSMDSSPILGANSLSTGTPLWLGNMASMSAVPDSLTSSLTTASKRGIALGGLSTIGHTIGGMSNKKSNKISTKNFGIKTPLQNLRSSIRPP